MNNLPAITPAFSWQKLEQVYAATKEDEQMRFADRKDAGRRLASAVGYLRGSDVVVLALPRGGAVVGAEVARGLEAPLGLVLVKKIGHPTHREYAIGALAEDDEPVYNIGEALAVAEGWLTRAVTDARRLIARRKERYYGDDFSPPDVQGKVVVVVDDGAATGLTMEAALRSVRSRGAQRVVVALPIASVDSLALLRAYADEVVVLEEPVNFLGSVGSHYAKFAQVTDEEVARLLREVRDGIQGPVTATH